MSDWPAITDVLSHYGFELPPPRGGWTRVRCVFHGDKTPSAAFNVELSGYSCLSCGVKGDGLKIIGDREGVGFAQAKQLAESWFGSEHSPLRNAFGRGGRMANSPRYRFGDREEVPTRFRSDSLFGGT